MSGSHCTPHWGATIHLKQKKKSHSVDLLVVGGAAFACGPSGSSTKVPARILGQIFQVRIVVTYFVSFPFARFFPS